MNIETTLLPELCANVVAAMKEQHYSRSALNLFESTYGRLILYLNEGSHELFNLETGIKFIEECYNNREKPLSKSYLVGLQRPIRLLFEFHASGAISTRRFTFSAHSLTALGEAYDLYATYQAGRNLKASTLKSKLYIVKRFLLYMEGQNVLSLMDVSANDVYKYLQTLKEHTVSSREGVLYALRDALRFFSGADLCGNELRNLFPQISTHSGSPVPSCFSAEEMRTILSSINRDTAIGKRDYAVVLLAAFLGIRAGDISNLKMSSIKWGNESIEFTQSKTGRFLQLPLLSEVKFAILDYMKNGRPETASENLFVKHYAPYGPFGKTNCFHHVVNKYTLGIDLGNRRHGLHALRFSAAGNMLSVGTPITTICNVLGHSYTETTKRYLKIDVDSLRKAALEVE